MPPSICWRAPSIGAGASSNRAADWKYGPKRDDVLRLHPMLRDWNDITPAEREENRALVRRIPAIVKKAGFVLTREQVVPLPPDDIALAAIAARAPGVTLVLIVDPSAPEQIDHAEALARAHGARLRLIWRGAQALNDVDGTTDLRPGTGGRDRGLGSAARSALLLTESRFI